MGLWASGALRIHVSGHSGLWLSRPVGIWSSGHPELKPSGALGIHVSSYPVLWASGDQAIQGFLRLELRSCGALCSRSLVFWGSGHPELRLSVPWAFGTLSAQGSGHLRLRPFGALGIRGSDHPGIRPSGAVGIRGSGWACKALSIRVLLIWVSGLLELWSSGSLVVQAGLWSSLKAS